MRQLLLAFLSLTSLTSVAHAQLGYNTNGLRFRSTWPNRLSVCNATDPCLWVKDDGVLHYTYGNGTDYQLLNSTLSAAYSNGTGPTDETISLDNTRKGVLIQDNGTPITPTVGLGLFDVTSSGASKLYLDVTSSGLNSYGPFNLTTAAYPAGNGWLYLANTSPALVGTQLQVAPEILQEGRIWDGAASRSITSVFRLTGTAGASYSSHWKLSLGRNGSYVDAIEADYNGTNNTVTVDGNLSVAGASSSSNSIVSGVADGASAVGNVLDSTTDLATAGAKWTDIRSGGSSRIWFGGTATSRYMAATNLGNPSGFSMVGWAGAFDNSFGTGTAFTLRNDLSEIHLFPQGLTGGANQYYKLTTTAFVRGLTAVGANLGAVATPWDALYSYTGFMPQDVGTAQTAGLSLYALNAATAIATQKYSPLLSLSGYAWNPTAAASQAVEFGVQTSTTSANPVAGNLNILSRLNGGAWTTQMILGATNRLNGPVTDGATAVSFIIDTTPVELLTAGARLTSFRNATAEKAAVMYDGSLLTPQVGATTATMHALPTGTGAVVTTDASQALSSKTLTTPVISTGMTASGSASNDFSGSTGAFKTSTGAVTIGPGAVTLSGNMTTNAFVGPAYGGTSTNVPSNPCITPTLLNSWVNYDAANYASACYYKDSMGIVHIRGVVKSGTSASAIIFNLPAGYRPLRIQQCVVLTATTGTLQVAANGDVNVAAGGSTGSQWIGPIEFFAEQ